MTTATDTAIDLHARLADVLGADHVLTGDEDRAFYSQDIYSAGQPAAVVVRPGGREELARAVATATAAGYSVIPRGGATSYTGGFLPDRPQSVIVDFGRMDRVVEVEPENMFVTVEAGCTWKTLYETLEPLGVRTPFWGPLSGRMATVGGSLSQNAVLWGSARYGVSAESVLGLEVVLADGTLLVTGSGGTSGDSGAGVPFFRHYGPDLTGLFLGDTGALGIKARATLRLIQAPAASRHASFSFTSHGDLAAAMTEIARSGLAAECFGMDPVLQRQRMKRESLKKDLAALKGVVASAGGLGRGVKEAVKVAVAGRRFLDDGGYSMHVVTEGRDDHAADSDLAAIRAICSESGHEVENTIPKVMRGDPFMITLTSAIGPEGERWAPMHGIVPLGQAAGAWSEVSRLFDEYRERFERHGVVVGFLLAVVGTTGFIIEPVFYWPGPRPLLYDRRLEPAELARLKDFPESPETAALVAEVRERLADRFLELGAAHLQIGRAYRYKEGLDDAAWRLLEAIKDAVDPRRLVNPGSLGLD